MAKFPTDFPKTLSNRARVKMIRNTYLYLIFCSAVMVAACQEIPNPNADSLDAEDHEIVKKKLVIGGLEELPAGFSERFEAFLDKRKFHQSALIGSIEDAVAWCFLGQDDFGYSINMAGLPGEAQVEVAPAESQTSPRDVLSKLQEEHGLRVSVSKDGVVVVTGNPKELDEGGLK